MSGLFNGLVEQLKWTRLRREQPMFTDLFLVISLFAPVDEKPCDAHIGSRSYRINAIGAKSVARHVITMSNVGTKTQFEIRCTVPPELAETSGLVNPVRDAHHRSLADLSSQKLYFEVEDARSKRVRQTEVENDLAQEKSKNAHSEQLTKSVTRPRGYNNKIVSSQTSGVKKRAYVAPTRRSQAQARLAKERLE